MDIVAVSNIVVPLVSVAISSAITMIGVAVTIKSENKRFRQERLEHEKDRLEREKEREQLQFEKNQEKNEQIIRNRPQFRVVENIEITDHKLRVSLLPQSYGKLNDLQDNPFAQNIIYEYPAEIFDDSYWDEYSVVLKNIGGFNKGGFLHMPDQSHVNIYIDSDFMDEYRHYLKNYSEIATFSCLEKGETVRLTVRYPKTRPDYKEKRLDLFVYDVPENCWRQDDINHAHKHTESYPISDTEYGMNSREELVKWQVIRRLFFHNWNKENDRSFDFDFANTLLQAKTDEYNRKFDEFEQYRKDIKDGKRMLKS